MNKNDKLTIWVGSIGFQGDSPIDVLANIFDDFDREDIKNHFPIRMKKIRTELFSTHPNKREAKELYSQFLSVDHPYHETHAIAWALWFAKYGEDKPNGQMTMEDFL